MVSTPMASREGASRFHSFFASSNSQVGHLMLPLGGIGSFSLSGRLPGLPSRILSAVGLGFRPLVAMLVTSLRKESSY